jgi:squalene/oxidosqualene cyclase-like protein
LADPGTPSFRHAAQGGWPFSNTAHGWPISDCTSEALLALSRSDPHQNSSINDQRISAAVKLLLSWQNSDGGWATYEKTRAPRWLERLNPSQVFGDIMIDYSCVECTSACVQAFAMLSSWWRNTSSSSARELGKAIRNGMQFLIRHQRSDGSFEGSWGVCFTYGTWFGVSGLRAGGLASDHPRIRSAARFLVQIQKKDGSWGESPLSSIERRYVEHPVGQVVMTSWALLALLQADQSDVVIASAQRRGVEFLVRSQDQSGAFPSESYAGVFSRTSMLNYENYRHIFPLWAMGEWLATMSTETGEWSRSGR